METNGISFTELVRLMTRITRTIPGQWYDSWSIVIVPDDDLEKRLLEMLENEIEAKGVKQEKRQSVSLLVFFVKLKFFSF